MIKSRTEMNAAQRENLVVFTHLARRFGRHWALKDANGSIAAGEITALTGENGSGKSTLFLVLAGILRPHRGRVSFAETRRLHLVSHHLMAYPDLPVLQNLRLAAQLTEATKDAVAVALDFWGIAELKHRPLRFLSRGQQQRFLLARAMLANATVLLLDEPFTGLDSLSEQRLLDFLHGAAQNGAAIFFSEHDPRRARALAIRTIRMSGGVCYP